MRNETYHKKYRDLLEKNAVDAPDDVWDSIASQLGEDAIELRVDDEDQMLLDEVWGNIENELDVDEVWGNIENQLEEKSSRSVYYKLRYWIAVAILLLIIGLTGVLQLLSNQDLMTDTVAEQFEEQMAESVEARESVGILKPTMGVSVVDESTPEVVKENVNDKQKIRDRRQSNKTKAINIEPDVKAKDLHYPIKESRTLSSSPIHTSGSFFTSLDEKALIRRTDVVLPLQEFKLDPTLVLPNTKAVNSDWITAFKPTAPVKEDDVLAYDRKDSRWTTGVVTALKNTYLLNDETIEGFSPEGMNSSKMTVLPNVGLNVQYAINKRYIFDTNLFYSSTSKQRYSLYNHGEYGSKDLQLDYVAGEFAIKQNAKKSIGGSQKIIRRNIAGVYVAHLKSASEAILDQTDDVVSKYAAIDYGLLLGQEFEWRTKGPIKVSTGLTVKCGLPNIYTGDNNMPGSFNKTHNASVEFRIGIAYRWKAKVGIDHYLGFKAKQNK